MDLWRRQVTGPSEASWDDASINRALEDAFLHIRVGKQARLELEKELPARGAVAVFPVAVFAPGLNARKSLRPYALTLSVEPGTVLPIGVHEVQASGVIKEQKIRGVFYIQVGGSSPASLPTARWEIKEENRWIVPGNDIEDLLSSRHIPASPKARLRRDLRRIIHTMEYAYADLYNLSMPTMRSALQKYQAALFHQSASLDLGDILQECWIRHLQRVETYASPQRPNATWRQVLVVNTRRDGGRELRRNPHKISDQVAQLVGLIRNNPDLRAPEDIQRYVTIAKEVAIREKKNPKKSRHELTKEVEVAWEKGKLPPRLSLRVAENAFLAAPFENTVSLSAPVSSTAEMSQNDFIADEDPHKEGENAFELGEQLKEVEEILYLLFPEEAAEFMETMGLSSQPAESGNFKNSGRIGSSGLTAGSARRQILRKLKSKNPDPATEEVRKRLAQIVFNENGEIRSSVELQHLLGVAEGKIK